MELQKARDRGIITKKRKSYTSFFSYTPHQNIHLTGSDKFIIKHHIYFSVYGI